MALTLEQLAKRVCPPHGDVAAITERIKRWSKTGLLPSLNRPGRGRVRIWEPYAAVDAAVLNALADLKGLSPHLGLELRSALALVRPQAGQWAIGDQRPRWLQLAWAQARHPLECSPELFIGELKPDAIVDGAVILNLHALFRRLRWSKADETAGADHKPRRARSVRPKMKKAA
jgi:hypothetical protein